MLRILADNPDNAFALDNFALLAHRLHGCSNFHAALSFLKSAFRLIWRAGKQSQSLTFFPYTPTQKAHSTPMHFLVNFTIVARQPCPCKRNIRKITNTPSGRRGLSPVCCFYLSLQTILPFVRS